MVIFHTDCNPNLFHVAWGLEMNCLETAFLPRLLGDMLFGSDMLGDVNFGTFFPWGFFGVKVLEAVRKFVY